MIYNGLGVINQFFKIIQIKIIKKTILMIQRDKIIEKKNNWGKYIHPWMDGVSTVIKCLLLQPTFLFIRLLSIFIFSVSIFHMFTERTNPLRTYLKQIRLIYFHTDKSDNNKTDNRKIFWGAYDYLKLIGLTKG